MKILKKLVQQTGQVKGNGPTVLHTLCEALTVIYNQFFRSLPVRLR
jgi:hypothetical protein